jgi:hypothetical protein
MDISDMSRLLIRRSRVRCICRNKGRAPVHFVHSWGLNCQFGPFTRLVINNIYELRINPTTQSVGPFSKPVRRLPGQKRQAGIPDQKKYISGYQIEEFSLLKVTRSADLLSDLFNLTAAAVGGKFDLYRLMQGYLMDEGIREEINRVLGQIKFFNLFDVTKNQK